MTTIEIKKGIPIKEDLDKLHEVLFNSNDGLYDIVIIKHKNKRSLQQNKYYWKVVIPFIQDCFNAFPRPISMNQKQAHMQFKDMAGWYEEVQIYEKEKQFLETQRLYKSMSNMGDVSTVDFMNALEIVRFVISELTGGEYILPDPISPL